MDLPFLKKKKAPDEGPVNEVFLVVRLTQSMAQASLCNVDGQGKTTIIANSEFVKWDGMDVSQLIDAVDQCLSQVMAFLPEEWDAPDRVLYGVPAQWVEDRLPLQEYRDLLKQMSKELELKAMGFAVSNEAVINLLNQQESASLTAVLVTVDRKWVEVSLCFHGKVQQVEVVERSDDLLECLGEAFKRFPENNIPSRVLLFDGGEDLNPIWEELVNFDWEQADWGFMHLPKVELLPGDVPIKGLMTAAGQALRRKINIGVQEKIEKHKDLETEKQKNLKTEELQMREQGELDEDSRDEDEAEEKKLEEEKLDQPVEGFVIGQDIREVDSMEEGETQDQKTKKPKDQLIAEPRDCVENPQMAESDIGVVPAVGKGLKINKPSMKFNTGFGMRFPKIPWKLVMALVVILGLTGGGVYWWVTNLKSSVRLLVEPEKLTNELMVIIDPELSEADVGGGRLPGQMLSVEIDGAKSMETTGRAVVGERASGEVTIFNDTETTRDLEAGTIITASSKDLNFTLNENVQIASKSVDLEGDTPFKPGSAKVKVTAESIGAEYNLESKTLFSVANFSQASLLAKNDESFSGGSSREVQSVSEDDLVSLRESLTAELRSQAVSKLKEKLGEGQELIESSVEIEVVDEEFDQEVGDEAESLSLNMRLRFKGVSYSRDEFARLVSEQLSNKVPLQKELSEVVKTDFQLRDEESEEFVYRVETESYLLPKLNVDSIKSKIQGKRPEVVKEYLLSLPGVSKIKYEVMPKLPAFLNYFERFPFTGDGIEMEVIPEE